MKKKNDERKVQYEVGAYLVEGSTEMPDIMYRMAEHERNAQTNALMTVIAGSIMEYLRKRLSLGKYEFKEDDGELVIKLGATHTFSYSLILTADKIIVEECFTHFEIYRRHELQVDLIDKDVVAMYKELYLAAVLQGGN